jgi:hypothetical protein
MENELLLKKVPSVDGKHFSRHQCHKIARNERFENNVYGVVQTPVIPKNVIGFWEPPTYLLSRRTLKYKKYNNYINVDTRCFYLGIRCNYAQNKSCNFKHDPKIMPWLATKDHLVPVRRHISSLSIDVSKYPPATVLSSNIANTTLGLAPLPVRIKIREWLSTSPYDRDNVSIESGNNLRWLIINMLDHFRVNGRFPWSRNKNGTWWYPDISEPWMLRCNKMEKEFLELNDNDRDMWIKKFVWNF